MRIYIAYLFILLRQNVSAQDSIRLSSNEDLPMIAVYKALNSKIRTPAVIICPGGGYAYRSREGEEGTLVCQRLQANGICAILLDYRLPGGNDTIPLHDAQWTITYIRDHAKQFNIDKNQVGIWGYSAGGHLASTAGTHWTSKYNRPDFMVLAYPVISMKEGITHAGSKLNLLGEHPSDEMIDLYSNELQVTNETPGTYITHAMDDEGVLVSNSLYFYAALLQHRIPAEIFIYANGGHAYGMGKIIQGLQWVDPCIKWIKRKGWLK